MRNSSEKAAWSGLGLAVMAVFAGLAVAAYDRGQGPGNEVPQPAFALFVLGALIGLYMAVSPLLDWWPHHPPRTTPKRKREWRGHPKSYPPEATRPSPPQKAQPEKASKPSPKPVPKPQPGPTYTASLPPDRAILQELMDRGVDLQRRCPDNYMKLAGVFVSVPTTQRDIDLWVGDVEAVLALEPEKLSWFRLGPDQTIAGLIAGMGFPQGPLRSQMDRHIEALAEIMRNNYP